MKKNFLIPFFCLIITIANAQEATVGTRHYASAAFEGYSLLSPVSYHTTFLLNNCGEIINEWQGIDNNAFFVEITQQGNLLKGEVHETDNFFMGGAAGWIREYDWGNKLIWEILISDSTRRLHHDMELMPNGNILAIAWEKMSRDQSIAAGRDPSLLEDEGLWFTGIYEIKPILPDTYELVWEWHAWDHLVQDFDSSKANYGVVSQQIGQLDINKGNTNNYHDWAHVNGIDYHPDYDQIILSSPMFNELWIIDHSTSTQEAATSSGGLSGRGGSILWRWGNPLSYNRGTSADKQLFFQHDGRWINTGQRFVNSISVFSNRDQVNGASRSIVKIIDPGFDTTNHSYPLSDGRYLPLTPSYQYVLADTLYAPRVSGAQVLPNDNMLITSGSNGRIIEIDDQETSVWDYLVPITRLGMIVEQGTLLNRGATVFKLNKIAPDHPGLTNKILTPGNPIETFPIACELVGENEFISTANELLSVFPNPINDMMTVSVNQKEHGEISVLNMFGQEIYRANVQGEVNIHTSQWQNGIYVLRFNQYSTKIIKK